MLKDITYYKYLFANMNWNKTGCPALHKPVLLLGVMILYEIGFYVCNHIVRVVNYLRN